MAGILADLEPKAVFKYFEEISMIPRESDNERAICDYLIQFAEARKYEYFSDSELNVIIKKPASPGYENAPTVIIQGHMDMVCEKNLGTVHDFSTDPLKLRIVGGMIYATDTTLGADNGIALAYGLALLDSTELEHPALEVVFTSKEETSMAGAQAIAPELLNGRMLINIDNDVEGELLVGCAGGVDIQIAVPVTWQTLTSEKHTAVDLIIRGLQGGHSGTAIHLGRGNANKLMGRILSDMHSISGVSLASINGGSKSNAIPRECATTLVLTHSAEPIVRERIGTWEAVLREEFSASDPQLRVECSPSEVNPDRVFSADTVSKFLEVLNCIDDGVRKTCSTIPGLVESSSNVGIIRSETEASTIVTSIRSSVEAHKHEMVRSQQRLAMPHDFPFMTSCDYPEWEFAKESPVRDLCERVYLKMYGKAPKLKIIHAGLECGILGKKFEHLDMVSFGPDIYDIHSPDEHMSIASVARCWEYLLNVLKAIKTNPL